MSSGVLFPFAGSFRNFITDAGCAPVPRMAMLVPSSLEPMSKRRCLRWIVVFLAVILLTGFGSASHGQACTCDKGSTEICQVCEIHHLDSAIVPTTMAIGSSTMEADDYALPTSMRLVSTDLDQGHPPPEPGFKG
jgi:hypothetical protein